MWVKTLASILSRLLIGISLAAAQECYGTGNFATNSTYGKNRDMILDSPSGNVFANGGFFTATIGQDTNKVYALGLCRGDSTPFVCDNCVNSAVRDLRAQCPNQKEAVKWEGDPPCIVRYANRSFFGILELEPTTTGYNTGRILQNLTQFDTVWESLMDNVVRTASNGSSTLKYATGEADLTASQKIYAMMQCTPDLSQKDCDTCLRRSVIFYVTCCHGYQGGYVQKPNCWLRWDLYPFYVSNPATTAPALSPPPTRASPPTITKGN